MIALISDIHANLAALCAVLDDIETCDVKDIACLGDIVGYGADPEACTDMVMDKAQWSLKGNHDFALINAPYGFNHLAADIIRITKARMDPASGVEGTSDDLYCPCDKLGQSARHCLVMDHTRRERWDYLDGLAEKRTSGRVLYVHGAPLDPTFEYIFPDTIPTGWNPDRIALNFEAVDHIAFCGHTHHPCAITSTIECIYPASCGYRLKLDPALKYIINTGSVGQPRDGDVRASYALFDEENETVEWRRVPYDIEASVKKIETMCGEGNFCATRLRLGK